MEAFRVRFVPSGRRVRARPGASLLQAIVRAGLPVARACGGQGLCGRCGVRILSGSEGLPRETQAEVEAKRRNRTDPDLRLACQVVPGVDLEVTAPYWSEDEREDRETC